MAITSWLQDTYMQIRFSPKAAQLLIKEQGLDSQHRLQIFPDKNVDDICNVVRKPGRKNANGMPDREQQVSVITQETLMLAVFLFHCRWGCTFHWKVMGLWVDRVHLYAS